MARETKTIVTPVEKKSVVLNLWITGREERDIKNAVFDGFSVKPDNSNEVELSGFKFTPEMLNASKDKAIEKVVVSVDGSNENVVDKVLDMHSVDTQFVLAEIDKITSPVQEEEKKS